MRKHQVLTLLQQQIAHLCVADDFNMLYVVPRKSWSNVSSLLIVKCKSWRNYCIVHNKYDFLEAIEAIFISCKETLPQILIKIQIFLKFLSIQVILKKVHCIFNKNNVITFLKKLTTFCFSRWTFFQQIFWVQRTKHRHCTRKLLTSGWRKLGKVDGNYV